MENYSFHHVSVNVKNIEKSRNFYHQLGFSDFYSYSDDLVSIIHLDNKGFILELFCYKGICDYFYEPRHLKKHHDFIGCEHFSLSVDDIEKAYHSLRPFVENDAVITKGRTEIEYFFILDPDGTRIEIVKDDRKSERQK